MKRSDYLIGLGIAAAAGTVAGMLSDRKHPGKGGMIGAASAVVSVSVAAGVYHYITVNKAVPFYSDSSDLYDDAGLT